MYCFLYTSSDYYDDSFNQDEIVEEDNNICIICWFPEIPKNPIKNMKEFSYVISRCHCNVLIHEKCLIQWLSNSSSCPICRKNVKQITTQNCSFYICLKYFVLYFFFFSYTSILLQIANFISVINLFIFYVYTIYIFYHFGNAFYEENNII